MPNETNIEVKDGTNYISENAFFDCKKLTSINIPNSVTRIGDAAFEFCEGLTSITIPNKVTKIGLSTFGWCSNLSSVTIPNSVISIGDFAFVDCKALSSVTIPNSVTSIGQYAFSGCIRFTSITIPNSVIYIGKRAFAKCTGVTTISSLAATPPVIEDSVFARIDTQICTLYVPSGSEELYASADQWKDFANIKSVSTGIGSVVTDASEPMSVTATGSAQRGDVALTVSGRGEQTQWTAYTLTGVAVGNGMLTADGTAHALGLAPQQGIVVVRVQNAQGVKTLKLR